MESKRIIKERLIEITTMYYENIVYEYLVEQDKEYLTKEMTGEGYNQHLHYVLIQELNKMIDKLDSNAKELVEILIKEEQERNQEEASNE